MTDETILRMVEETTKVLSRTDSYVSAKHLTPSYNALLQAAKENHPPESGLPAHQKVTPTAPITATKSKGRAIESAQPSNGIS